MTLTHGQRTRLIHSTRKLGALLGETPAIEVAEPTSRPGSRPSTASSTKSTVSTRSLLTITIPAATIDCAQRSPLSPTYNLNRDSPYNPLSPSNGADDSVLNALELKRKKVAKLARTFGENVPPELVTIGAYEDLLSTPETHVLDFERAPSRASDVSESSPLIKPPPRSLHTRRITKNQRPSSTSFVLKSPRLRTHHAHTASEVPNARRNSDRELAFAKLTQRPATRDGHLRVDETHRKESGWSGEWNQGDMKEVVKRLRNLK